MIDSPATESELLERATALAGLTLQRLAEQLRVPVPADLRRHKGWTGQLVERALGADAASLAEPDFRHLGIEMKTLPVDHRGQPCESTYVCTVPLEAVGEHWESCWVRRKLARVLWIPVQGERHIAINSRRIGMPLLWSPTAREQATLRRDWEELTDMVAMGRIEEITARYGEVLQIRPKAADSRARRGAIGPDGRPIRVNPRGFYLRPAFTAAILARHYAV